MTSDDHKLSFLLAGKTGTGKSATGNSLLGHSAFKCADASTSVTSEISLSSAERQGYTLTVVDAPGVMDTSVNSTEAKWKSCREMIHAMSTCPTTGKLAILLVLKYGERFTEENRATVRILKNIFGEENLWKSCIIIFTHGDLFDGNYEGGKRFEDWLREQSGELGKIIENCRFKCVLFHNKAKFPVKQEEQLKHLIDFVDQLDQGYTKDIFDEAKKQRNRLELEGLMPKLVVEFQSEITSLQANMNSTVITSDSREEVMRLEDLVNHLLARINETDDPEKIFYDSNETRLLENIRAEVECLIPKINLMKVDLLISNVEQIINVIDQANPRDEEAQSRLKQIETNADALWLKVAQEKLSPAFSSKLDPSISLAEQKLSRLRDEVKLAENARELNLKIVGLQDEVTNQKIPTLVSTFTAFTERADHILAKLNADSLQPHDKADLLEQITDLKTQIDNLKIENDMNIGWTSASAIIGVISAFTAFIPIVGIPISLGLNVAPVVGQSIHRAVERKRRQSDLKKRKEKKCP